MVRRRSLFFSHGKVHGPQDGGRRVDGHRGRDFRQRDVGQQDFHILERTDRHAAFSELAYGLRGVAVVAHQCRQVERNRESAAALREQVLVTGVGLFRRAETGELAHGPQAAALTGGMDGTGIGIFSRQAQVSEIVEIRQIERGVETVHFVGGGGDEFLLPFGGAFQRGSERPLFPFRLRFAEVILLFGVGHKHLS